MPAHYEQVFDGTELPNTEVMNGLGLRQDDAFSGFTGASVDLEMNLGPTTFAVTGITNSFAGNFNAGTPTNVLPRQNIVLPTMPPTNPVNPATFFIQIPFTTPHVYIPTAGQNLLLEVIQRGNSRGNAIFTYPLDAGSGITTTRLYGFPDSAVTGTLGTNYGMVMFFNHIGAGNSTPRLSNTGRPIINSSFSVDLSLAAANTVAILFTGLSNTNFHGFPLPINLTGVGAPLCNLLVSDTIVLVVGTNGAGAGTQPLAIPNDNSLSGAVFYQQYIVLDAGANAFGFSFSNGGRATIGTF